MIFRWVLTVPILGYLIFVAAPTVGAGGYGGAFGGVPMTAAGALCMALVWRKAIAGLVANPIGALYDGGTTPPDLRPAYSTAMARQKRGEYQAALEEIKKQLARFPTDTEGQFLMAQIQAENLKDVAAAEATIEAYCAQPNHAPKNIAFGLYSLADWYLQINRDREGARRALQRLVALLPDSEFSSGASHRLANLDSDKMVRSADGPATIEVTEGLRNIGLQRGPVPSPAPVGMDPALQAAEYVERLSDHPLDTETREKLAVLYADHFGRMDLAAGELEQLIAMPNQPSRLVAHWLNVMADLQIRSGELYETVSATLQRIIDRYPDIAVAEMARKRLALLRLELKSKAAPSAVKMGTYEQNIGLKANRKPTEERGS